MCVPARLTSHAPVLGSRVELEERKERQKARYLRALPGWLSN
jgi:hypothetical protein